MFEALAASRLNMFETLVDSCLKVFETLIDSCLNVLETIVDSCLNVSKHSRQLFEHVWNAVQVGAYLAAAPAGAEAPVKRETVSTQPDAQIARDGERRGGSDKGLRGFT